MIKKIKIFRSYWFLLALLILLLNDFILKEAFSNWFTGKLSDFAGLFVFVLFWSALFPKNKRFIYGITATLFVLWKSSWSQPFIDSWNSFGVLPIDRVADLTDLTALSVLPLAYFIQHREKELNEIRLSPVIPLVFSAFAFAATSYSTNEQLHETYEVNMPKDLILGELKALDSVNVMSNNSHSDTINISIENELCHDRINVTLTIVKVNDSTSSITLLDATHPCPKKEVEKQDIIEAFENKTIKKLGD